MSNQAVYTKNHQRPPPHSASCLGASGESVSVTEWVTLPAYVAVGTITTCVSGVYLHQFIEGKYHKSKMQRPGQASTCSTCTCGACTYIILLWKALYIIPIIDYYKLLLYIHWQIMHDTNYYQY